MCVISCSRIEISSISIPPPQVKGLQREAWAYHFLRVWYFPPLLFPFFYFKAVRATLFITNEWVERGKEIKIPLVQGCQCPVLSKKNSGFRRKIFFKGDRVLISCSFPASSPPCVCVCFSSFYYYYYYYYFPAVSFFYRRQAYTLPAGLTHSTKCICALLRSIDSWRGYIRMTTVPFLSLR